MTLTQIRHATVKVNLQRHNSASVSTFNYGFCYPPTPSLLSLDHVAIVRTRLPRQPNPHSRARGAFREPKPAGSFLGGFRTPAAARSAPSFMAGIRNPAQTEKNSVGAYVFRFATELGHCSTRSACLKRAIFGLMHRSKKQLLRGMEVLERDKSWFPPYDPARA
jgi:hypothetical protein